MISYPVRNTFSGTKISSAEGLSQLGQSEFGRALGDEVQVLGFEAFLRSEEEVCEIRKWDFRVVVRSDV